MWYLERTTRRANADFTFAVKYREKILSTVNSYLGMLRHMSAYKLRKRLGTIIDNSALSAIFEPAADYSKLTIRQRYTTKTYYKTAYRAIKQQYRQAA